VFTFSLMTRAQEVESGRVLEVYSDQPGVQFYTSNFLPDKDPLPGKEGAKYFKHGAFCLETQNYPNAINHVRNSILSFKIY
jgi:aldose 1-epimerase